MYSRIRQLLSLFLLVLLLVLTAAVSRRFSMRVDLTEDRLYSIHPFSLRVIQSLTEPVHLSYYVSPRLDGLSPIPQEIHDFLDDYAARSNGRIQVEYVDASQPEHAAAARERGIQPQQIEAASGRGSSAAAEAAEAAVYSGLVVSYAEEGFTLPFILDPTAVEYRVTTALQRLINGTQPIIGVLFGTDGLSLADTHREMQQQLEQVYRIIELPKGRQIPAEVAAVFLIGGRDLTAESIQHLDRFLVAGGDVLAAVDAVEIDLESNLYPEALESDHPVLAWLEHHGALLRPELVLDMYNRSIPTQGEDSSSQYQAYPHWVQIQGSGADPDHPFTAGFSAMDVYWPGTLTLIPGPGRETTPLLYTSPDSWVLRERYFTAPEDALQSRNASLDTDGNYIVAGEISGRFTPQPVGDAAPTSASEPAGDSRLVVIADADFSSDLIRYTGSGYNMLFLAGAADWLANDPAVLDMRTRGYANNRLNAQPDPAMYRVYAAAAQVIILLVVPLLPFAAGLFVSIRRRRITSRGQDPANAR